MQDKVSIEEIQRIASIKMLFIFGKSRSGTSILQSVLNSHPSITAPTESKFMMVLYPRFAGIKHWNEKDISTFVEELYLFPFFSKRFSIDRTVLTNYLISAKEVLTYSLAIKIIYFLRRREKENIIYISDKNPDYYLFLKKLFGLFPEAKFIHLVREPKDNVSSTMKTFGSKNAIHAAMKWLTANSLIEDLKKKMPGRHITVFYENMVESPATVFKSICDFLNIPFISEILNRKAPERVTGNSEIMDALAKRQSSFFSPISPSSVGKWRTFLQPFDAAATEKTTGKYALEHYGYKMEAPAAHVSGFKIIKGKCIYYIWQAFTRFRYKSYGINKIYSWCKQKIKGDTLSPADYY